MVFLAITRAGHESQRSLGPLAGPLWVAAGVVSDEELRHLRATGTEVTNFSHKIELHETEVIADAVEAIKEHHPGEPIWVES